MGKPKFAVLIGLISVFIAVCGYVWIRRSGAGPALIPAVGGLISTRNQIKSIPYYLQNDPQWASVTIGGSQEKMANAGCTVSCIAMGLTKHGYPINPSQLCYSLKEKDGFTDDGLIIWSKIGDVTSHKIMVEFPDLSHQVIDNELREENPVIAKIMLGGRIPHWVLIVGKDGQEYLIIDPLNSDKTLLKLSERSDNIYGIRVLRKA